MIRPDGDPHLPADLGRRDQVKIYCIAPVGESEAARRAPNPPYEDFFNAAAWRRRMTSLSSRLVKTATARGGGVVGSLRPGRQCRRPCRALRVRRRGLGITPVAQRRSHPRRDALPGHIAAGWSSWRVGRRHGLDVRPSRAKRTFSIARRVTSIASAGTIGSRSTSPTRRLDRRGTTTARSSRDPRRERSR